MILFYLITILSLIFAFKTDDIQFIGYGSGVLFYVIVICKYYRREVKGDNE